MVAAPDWGGGSGMWKDESSPWEQTTEFHTHTLAELEAPRHAHTHIPKLAGKDAERPAPGKTIDAH